jgi:hypothetical protein
MFRNKQFISFSIFNLSRTRQILFVSPLLSEAVRVIPDALRKIKEAARLFVVAVMFVVAVRVLVYRP